MALTVMRMIQWTSSIKMIGAIAIIQSVGKQVPMFTFKKELTK